MEDRQTISRRHIYRTKKKMQKFDNYFPVERIQEFWVKYQQRFYTTTEIQKYTRPMQPHPSLLLFISHKSLYTQPYCSHQIIILPPFLKPLAHTLTYSLTHPRYHITCLMNSSFCFTSLSLFFSSSCIRGQMLSLSLLPSLSIFLYLSLYV